MNVCKEMYTNVKNKQILCVIVTTLCRMQSNQIGKTAIVFDMNLKSYIKT